MSDRRELGEVTNKGALRGRPELDTITLYRDNDTRSYRLFIEKDCVPIEVAGHRAVRCDSCECCDLTFESLKELSEILAKAVAEHQPFYDGDEW